MVFLTLDDPGDYVMDDDEAIPHLEALGWRVETRPWGEPGPLNDPPALTVVRSAWDYHRQPEAFLGAMHALERAGWAVENPVEVLRWSTDKRYMRDLEARGVPIVPTRWMDGGLVPGALAEAASGFASPEIILKPTVGASAEDTLRIPVEEIGQVEPGALELFRERPLQLQPFIPAVVDEGEYSLMYMGGTFSHAILKTPARGDFRVQEEHGSHIVGVSAGEDLRAAARRVLEAVPFLRPLLYARVDLVRHNGEWLLMELELVEPSLYLRMETGAPDRFARAVDAHIRTGAAAPGGGT